MYKSTKEYGHEQGLSCCFRQWAAESHCNLLHGYAIAVKLTFRAEELDHRNWVQDFGGLKEVKEFLKNTFDHKLLVATNDPELWAIRKLDEIGLADVVEVPAVGCEAFAKLIHDAVCNILIITGHDRIDLESVEVKEHAGNSAIYCV